MYVVNWFLAKEERLVVFSIGVAETAGYGYVGKKMNLTHLPLYTKINSRWILNL